MNWRPHNETNTDLANEDAIANDVLAHLGLDQKIKLSETLYHVDYALFDTEKTLAAWVEAKFRSSLYNHILLGCAKALSLYRLELATHTPAYFAISSPAGQTMIHRVKAPNAYRIESAGNSRGQNGDIEPCIMIPLNHFTRITPPTKGDFAYD